LVGTSGIKRRTLVRSALFSVPKIASDRHLLDSFSVAPLIPPRRLNLFSSVRKRHPFAVIGLEFITGGNTRSGDSPGGGLRILLNALETLGFRGFSVYLSSGLSY